MNSKTAILHAEPYLDDYHTYGKTFSQQLFVPELWKEHTGCDITDYKSYLGCCMNRLYDFKTWFEHSSSMEYPEDWEHLADYKFNMDFFSA